jgi:hypothetical protein
MPLARMSPQRRCQPRLTKSELIGKAIAEGRAFCVGVIAETASDDSADSGASRAFKGQEIVALLPEKGAGQRFAEAMRRLAEECLEENGLQSVEVAEKQWSFDSDGNIPLAALILRGRPQEREKLLAACALWMQRAPEALGVAFVSMGQADRVITPEDIQNRRDEIALAMQEASEMSAEFGLKESEPPALRGAANGAADVAESQGAANAGSAPRLRL